MSRDHRETAWDRQRLWEREQKAKLGIGPTPAGNPHAEVMCCSLCGRPPEHAGDGMTECETPSCGMWGFSLWWRSWNSLQMAIIERIAAERIAPESATSGENISGKSWPDNLIQNPEN